MTKEAIILWLLCLACETIGQLLFKAVALRDADAAGSVHWRIMLTDIRIWLGIGCYVIEFLLYMAFLSLVPLAQGVLITSISIMTIMIGGRIFFDEKLSSKRIAAGMLIAAGVSMVGWG